MSSEIFFLVASLVRKSLRIEIVDILSDRKTAQPLLKFENIYNSCQILKSIVEIYFSLLG
jgi:hypothetical protein